MQNNEKKPENHAAAQQLKLIAAWDEVTESIISARELLNELFGLSRDLSKATNWGCLDVFGGGLFSKPQKHQHLGQAKQRIANIKRSTKHYKAALAALSSGEEIQLDIPNWLLIIDKFSNTFLSELYIQSKANSLIRRLTDYQETLTRHIELLEEKETALDKAIDNQMKTRA